MLGDYVFQARIRLIIGSLSFNADYSSKIPSRICRYFLLLEKRQFVLFCSPRVLLLCSIIESKAAYNDDGGNDPFSSLYVLHMDQRRKWTINSTKKQFAQN